VLGWFAGPVGFLVMRHSRASTGLAIVHSCLQTSRRWTRDMFIWQSQDERLNTDTKTTTLASFSTFTISIMREISFQRTISVSVRHVLTSRMPDIESDECPGENMSRLRQTASPYVRLLGCTRMVVVLCTNLWQTE
jgi:hypothetical protein